MMSEKKDARIITTKKNIQEAAVILMTTQPDFSITTLLDKAQTTRGTFYKYYQNKPHLIDDVNDNLLLELTQHIQGQFHVVKMIRAISDRAAFYNAVLNLNTNTSYFNTLMTRMRSQVTLQLAGVTDDYEKRKLMFQWEVVIGGFWALIAAWLADNMDINQTILLQEFTDILRVNTTGATQTGLSLFDFSEVV